MKATLFFLVFSLVASCNTKPVERTKYFPKQEEKVNGNLNKQKVWVFIMAGQSNMAGRGTVEPRDTVPDKGILTINKNGELIVAKEPLHFYEPSRAGLDCGYSFGKTIIELIPDSISILLIPTAIGGSSISQWLGDSLYREVKVYSNFVEKTEIGKKYGVIKGILWHQGESDANEQDIPHYGERLSALFARFRAAVGNKDLPILVGELAPFPKNQKSRELINSAIGGYSLQDKNIEVIRTIGLKDRGDSLHFDSKGQRILGHRFAEHYMIRWIFGH